MKGIFLHRKAFGCTYGKDCFSCSIERKKRGLG